MSIAEQVQRFKSLGLPGKEVRCVAVYVKPAVEVRDGALVQTHKIHVGEDGGEMRLSFPTEIAFASMHTDWAFERFTLADKSFDGIAIFPESGDFTVAFGDPEQNSVVINDACGTFYAHRYQIVMKHKTTGELLTTDPIVANEDRDSPDP